MGFRGDDRGVTVQVGAILLFGMLVVSMSMYQTTVVPHENEQVEFQHSQHVQEDMQSVRSAVSRAGGSGSTQSVAVRLGTQFPERTVFVNPPAPSGTLQTDAVGDIEIRNARALDDETADYWSPGETKSFSTNAVRYEPNYYRYQNAPTTVYESSVLYNEFSETTHVPQSGQSLVDGRRISLVAVDGDLSQSQTGTLAVDVRPTSVSERTVTVEGDGGPLTVAIPSALGEETWRTQLLDGEYDTDGAETGDEPDDGRYVVDVTKTDGVVELTFESGYDYDLDLAKVGVGTGVTEPTPTYLTAVSGDGESVPEGGERRLVAEVRDEFDNPVSGVQVSASVDGPGTATPTAVSGSDGRAVFTYSAPADVDGQQSATVTAEFGTSPGAKERAEFDLSVTDSDASGGGADDINPNSERAVILNDSAIVEDRCDDTVNRNGDRYCKVDVLLENLDDGNAQNVESVRFNFYDVDATSGSDKTDAPQAVKLVREGEEDVLLRAANSGGRYETVDPKIDIGPGGTQVVRLQFLAETSPETNFAVEQGDFFVFSVVYDSGRTATYFVAPEVGELSGGSGSDSGGDAGQTPQLSLRLDDHTGLDQDTPRYVLSYDVANANSSFERVEATFENTNDGSASATADSTQSRGSLEYTNGYGAGVTYDVTLDVVYEGADGEYVATSRTFSDVTDGINWDGNQDLSDASTPTLASSDIEDRSTRGNNDLAYRVDYDVSGSNFGRVQLALVSLSDGGPTDFATSTARKRNNVDLTGGYGVGNEYKVAILVYDDDGAVVDARIVTDTADGTDP